MRRKTILWIVAAVIAAAVIAAVGIVAYHVGFNHGGGSVVAGPRRFGFVTPRVVLGGAGPSAPLSLLLLLIGGAVGAAIGYLAWGGRGGVTAATVPVAGSPSAPPDTLRRQFDEWHRSVHAAPPVPAPAPPRSPETPPPPAASPPVAPSTPSPDPEQSAPAAAAEPPSESSDSG